MPSTILSNGNEHDEFGFTTIDPIKVVAMSDKRFRKSDALAQEISTLDPVKIFGDTNPDITLVGWGSTKGPALEAIRLLKEEGKMVNFIQIVYLEPFPSEAMKEAMKNSGRSLLLETNVTNQLERLVKEKTSIKFDKSFTKYSGRPFNPYEIAIEARRLL